MKALSKFCRFSLVLLLALTVAFSAAVGVSAVEETFEYPVTLYSYSSIINPSPTYRPTGTDFSGTATSLRAFGPMIEFQHAIDTSYVLVITFNQSSAINSLIWSNNLIMAQLNSGEAASIQFPGNIIDVTTAQLDLQQNTATYVITYNTSGMEYADTYDRAYFAWSTNFTGSSTYRIEIQSATAYAIYDPPGTTLKDIEIQINTLINQNQTNSENLQSKIDQLIQSQNGNSSDIKDALEDIKDNQEIEQNYWQTVLTYGNTYNQIDQTLINNLGSAEDQLNSAEDAIENKSKSLMQQASTGISKATTASQTLVSSLTSTIPEVYSFASDLIETTPPEVQAAVLAIPLLSFAVWLIGLRR